MKRLILVVLCTIGMTAGAQEKDSLLVMFWNMENFFDWTDQGTGESDSDFSSLGSRHWTKGRFFAKCDAISKSLMWIGDQYGRMPDFIGLAEIENKGVLTRLLSSTLLRKYGYGIIHYESQDRRGIDVAALYRKSSMTPVSTTVISPENLHTRDILHARMRLSDDRAIDFIVNHHPSKYGGAEESMHKRSMVMKELKHLVDSLCRIQPHAVAFSESVREIHKDRSLSCNIVAMGDFNDTPDATQFNILETTLVNHGLPLHQKGLGTIRYKGKWELIDFFLSTSGTHTSDMQVIKIPFLMTYEKKYPGEKPLRTYSGPRYIGGVSDHCPICIRVR